MDMLGAVHGRFQMLHLGHMEYILEGKKRCQHLIVGITNPDSIYTRYSESNPHRSAIEANPLTYYERLEMIRGALLEAGVPRKEFTIVPFPIAAYEHLLSYIPIEAKHYLTLYDDWSLEKEWRLKELGCEIEILWRRSNEDKITSGTSLRQKIANGEPWQDLVPPYVYEYTTKRGIDERIKKLYRK